MTDEGPKLPLKMLTLRLQEYSAIEIRTSQSGGVKRKNKGQTYEIQLRPTLTGKVF